MASRLSNHALMDSFVDAARRLGWGTLGKRMAAKVEPSPDGCWLWIGSTNPDGYGKIRGDGGAGSRTHLAHRLSFEMFVGPIPDGLTIDHLCRTRNCVNPDHLEPVTPQVNAMRGESPNVKAHLAGTCVRGHPRSESLLRRGTDRVVYCRACRREDRREPRSNP